MHRSGLHPLAAKAGNNKGRGDYRHFNSGHLMNDPRSIKQVIERFLRSLPPIEPSVLIVLAVSAGSLWGFIKTADAVFENETQDFDRWMVSALRDPVNPADPIGPPWMEEMARDISALGGFTWITFATIVIAGYLLIDNKTRMALFLLAATGSGALLSLVLKSFFARPRPDLVPHLSQVFTSSFPSGHSMLAAVVYLTMGSLLASVISNRTLKVYVMAVAVMLTTAVGVTRVYLGVHYPTDVLAGWLAGLVWALLCWMVARVLQIRGRVETASNGLRPVE
jgi:undecaprenyl-diphosphatase